MAVGIEHAPDLLVVGSGAAGLTAALTALRAGHSVEVLEADALLGGATALSEGMIWLPNNADALARPDAPSRRRAPPWPTSRRPAPTTSTRRARPPTCPMRPPCSASSSRRRA